MPAAVLVVAPVQDRAPPPAIPAPVQTTSAPTPAATVVPAMPAAPAASTPAEPAAPASSATELADPMLDPATPAGAQAAALSAKRADDDPLEGFNRAMFGLHQKLDRALYRPAAMGYRHVVPKPVRSGLRNFFSNLTEPVVFLNYLLQLRFGKAAETLARFAINSTVGLAGFIDVARGKGIRLPHRDNDLGDTLAYWGVGPGPYIFLPLLGPTTLRDVLGGPVDGAILPLAVGKPFTDWRYQVASGVIPGLDMRAESDADLKALLGGAVDPYATLRSVWLQNRAAEVAALRHHAAVPGTAPELDDPLADPAAGPSAPPAEPPADPAAAPHN